MPPIQIDQVRFCGQNLVIRSFSPGLHGGLMQILAPQPQASSGTADAAVTMDFHLAPPDEFDRVVPIDPEAEAKKEPGLILADQVYPDTKHHTPDGRLWREYHGLGRQFWDAGQSRYAAVFSPQAFEDHFPLRYLFLVIALSHFLRGRGVMPIHGGCVAIDGKGLCSRPIRAGANPPLA